jgi:hypothetical protein
MPHVHFNTGRVARNHNQCRTSVIINMISRKWLFFGAKRGFPPGPTGRVLDSEFMWEASLEKAAKRPPRASATCIRGFVAGAGVFLLLAPRMCRLRVWVAALKLIEAHSHNLSSCRRINFRDADQYAEGALSRRLVMFVSAHSPHLGAAHFKHKKNRKENWLIKS